MYGPGGPDCPGGGVREVLPPVLPIGLLPPGREQKTDPGGAA